jgi:hypothetical protein
MEWFFILSIHLHRGHSWWNVIIDTHLWSLGFESWEHRSYLMQWGSRVGKLVNSLFLPSSVVCCNWIVPWWTFIFELCPQKNKNKKEICCPLSAHNHYGKSSLEPKNAIFINWMSFIRVSIAWIEWKTLSFSVHVTFLAGNHGVL